MSAEKVISSFFSKWGLSLSEKNKDCPLSDIFLFEFKVIFEKYVTTIVNGKSYRASFSVSKCKNCISDYVIRTQLFYRKLQRENK